MHAGFDGLGILGADFPELVGERRSKPPGAGCKKSKVANGDCLVVVAAG
jgi:hypothetical protein